MTKKYSYKDPAEIMKQEGMNLEQETNKWKSNSKQKLSDSNLIFDIEKKIPSISHTIYFFNPLNTNGLSKIDQQKITDTSLRLNAIDQDYKHYFWTNSPALIPENIKNIPNMTIKLFDEFKNHKLWQSCEDLLSKGLKNKGWFVELSDIVRILVINKYGGIYHDADYEIYNSVQVNKYNKIYNFYVGQERPWNDFLIGNAIIAASPEHPVIKTAIDLLDRNFINTKAVSVPEYVTNPEDGVSKILFETGPVMLSIAYYKANNLDGNNDMLFEEKYLYNTEYARALAKDSKCYQHISNERIEYLSNIVVGADLLCGGWLEFL